MSRMNYDKLKHISNQKIQANPVKKKLKWCNTNYKRLPVRIFTKEEIAEWELQNPDRLFIPRKYVTYPANNINETKDNNIMTNMNCNRLNHIDCKIIPFENKPQGNNSTFNIMPVYQFDSEKIAQWTSNNSENLINATANNHFTAL